MRNERESEPRTEQQVTPAEVLHPGAFASDFSACAADSPGSIAWVQAMEVDPLSPSVDELFASLTQASQRGGRGICIADAHTKLLPRVGTETHMSPESYARMQQEAFLRFVSNGGALYYTNQPTGIKTFFPRQERNHMKSAGVVSPDTRQGVVWLGGSNLYEDALQKNADFLVRVDDPAVVQTITSVVETVIATTITGQRTGQKEQLLRDAIIPCTDDFTVFVDAGIHGKSTIQHSAFSLINNPDTTRLYITSQFPLDPFMQHLLELRMQDGLEVFTLLSHKDTSFFTSGRVSPALYSGLRRLADRYTGQFHLMHSPVPEQIVHAKLLLGETATGQREALFGSHNYFLAGQLFGTAEIALKSHNQPLNQQLHSTFWKMAQGTWASTKKARA